MMPYGCLQFMPAACYAYTIGPRKTFYASIGNSRKTVLRCSVFYGYKRQNDHVMGCFGIFFELRFLYVKYFPYLCLRI